MILWPDTFNNYFHTDVGVAAVEGLEAAGYRVVLPQGHVCCGRPLYDYGFLDLAKRYLRRTLDLLRDDIRAGVPVVGIEPSCLAVFKDELPKLLPHDDDAERLRRNAFHYSEFLKEPRARSCRRWRGKALLWGHCHHKATGGIDPERELLEQAGLEVEEVTGGCCGLAGSWGFEAGHYDISMQAGEHALLPAVREAAPETLIVADGFSCKTQIEQGGTGRRALHLAQVLKLAREGLREAGRLPRSRRRRSRRRAGRGAARRRGGAAAVSRPSAADGPAVSPAPASSSRPTSSAGSRPATSARSAVAVSPSSACPAPGPAARRGELRGRRWLRALRTPRPGRRPRRSLGLLVVAVASDAVWRTTPGSDA